MQRSDWDATKSPAAKRTAAIARQEAHDKLSPKEKLDILDRRLGVGIGAAKERARLNVVLETKKEAL